MIKHVLLTVILIFSWFTSASSQIILSGILQEDSGKTVPNTRISVAGGPSDVTDSKGQFSIRLSQDFIEGERVIIIVSKKDWVINHPLDGEWNLPNLKYQKVHTTKVIIVPKGSKKLWTDERFEKYIAKLSDVEAKKEQDKPKPIDFTYYLSEWANQYGFTPAEVKEQFDRWANQAVGSENKRTRALAEFYNKNFEAAAKLFDEAARDAEAELKKIEEEKSLKVLSAYNDRKGAGNSFFAMYRFREALERYLKAQILVKSRQDFPREWAEIRILTGRAKVKLSTQVQRNEAQKYLEEAVQDYRDALEVYTRVDYPQEWAITQNNLGIALTGQGFRTGGQQGIQLLAEAIQACKNALEVYTRADHPHDWAITQNNLCSTYTGWSFRTGGQQGIQLLAEAVQACKNALEVYTRADQPYNWAMTQNNLGSALTLQGFRTGGQQGIQLLAEAIQAYKNALEVYTRMDYPKEWAMTQNNLGSAYEDLEDWPNAALSYANAWEVLQDYEVGYQKTVGMAYQKAVYLYHEILFDFHKAYDLNASWLQRHPDDLLAQVNFAVKHFTTARFEDSFKSIETLLANPALDSREKIVLRVIELADIIALHRESMIQGKLAELQAAVSAEPENFAVGFSFTGTKRFIHQYEPLAPCREWLLSLFDAMVGENRDAILSGLRVIADKLPDLFKK